jgi:hypothetical protein
MNYLNVCSAHSYFIGGGNRRTRRKPSTCRKSLTSYHIKLYMWTSLCSRFELTTSVVIGTDCIGSCKCNYHTITATTVSLRHWCSILYVDYVMSKCPTFSCIFVLISYNIPEVCVYDKLLLHFYYVSNLDIIYNFNLTTLLIYDWSIHSFFISSICMKISKIHQHITHKQYYIIASSTDNKKFQTVLTIFLWFIYITHDTM